MSTADIVSITDLRRGRPVLSGVMAARDRAMGPRRGEHLVTVPRSPGRNG